MPPRVRVLAATLVALVALVACGDEPKRLTGADISFLAPAAAGSTQSVTLQGVERGEGTIGVVLAHMLGSSQSAWSPLTDRLVAEDFRVLTFDFRGHGLSGGDRNASTAALDLSAAVDKLRSLGVTKVFVVGASMGGTAAIVVAAAQKVDGVVAISAPLSIDKLDAREAVRALDEPSLFIAAEDDDARYTDAARMFASAAPRPKQLQIVKGSAAHGTDLLTDEETGEHVGDLILDFLTANRG